jgi:hypothetical protein
VLLVIFLAFLLFAPSSYAQQPSCEQLLDSSYQTAQALLQQLVQSKAQIRAEFDAKLAELRKQLDDLKKEKADEKDK